LTTCKYRPNKRQKTQPPCLTGPSTRLRESIDGTVAALVASQNDSTATRNTRQAIKERLTAAETRLGRFQAAIEAGTTGGAGRGGQRGARRSARLPDPSWTSRQHPTR
jgi:hypothetical protein